MFRSSPEPMRDTNQNLVGLRMMTHGPMNPSPALANGPSGKYGVWVDGPEPSLAEDSGPMFQLFSQRVWTHLKLHHLRQRSLAAFLVPGGVGGETGPHGLPLPAGIRIVEARGRGSGEVAHRIRHP